MIDRVYVVGVGAEGRASLTPRALAIVDRAELLVGGERLLAGFAESKAERLVLGSDPAGAVRQIEAHLGQRRVVVLASGDPGFFGIAKRLVGSLGKERVEIVPNLSSVQLAFARIKESWEDATFVSVHGRPLLGLAALVRRSHKVAILGDEVNSPALIAQSLLAAGVDGYRAYVCENLGGCDERVRGLDLVDLANSEASPLNVLILIQEEATKAQAAAEEGLPPVGAWAHGIADHEFYHRRPRRGMITKAEVRLASLARLGLRESSVVWDVGAGCGSVAIEAALIAWRGQVYAVERGAEDVALIRRNVAKFGTDNVVVVHAAAPAALAALPTPDAVFIGGSGGQLLAILDLVAERLPAGGRVVVNAATLETAGSATAGLRERGLAVEVTLMQVSRSRDLAGLTHFEALDPVFVVAGRRVRS